MSSLKITYCDIGVLIPYARNSRTHSDEQVAQVAASIREFGFTNPVLVDGDNGIIAGHGRVLAARKLGMEQVPTIKLDGLSDTQKRAYIIADNKLALNSGWDEEMLKLELSELEDIGFDLELTGFSAEEIELLMPEVDQESNKQDQNTKGSLADRFLIPPFSVLNAREGWWQDRKRAWLAIGIKSELGRGDDALFKSERVAGDNLNYYRNKSHGKAFKDGLASSNKYGKEEMTGTSIFDPVLCELAYLWFSPVGGTILDPFAGGSVRGIVAAKMGRQYIGGELREEQVAANRAQADSIILGSENMPAWICADSRNIDKTASDVQADMVFSCPPYADLEVYSDDKNDLSTLAYNDFKAAYFEIIKKSCLLLKNDRFACFVVGEVRDKKGNYYNFVGDTIQAFIDAGLSYYNEAILITMVGSLPIRTSMQFSSGRKLGKTHQNILVFVKGDGKKAAQACGDITISEDLFPDEVSDAD